MINPSCFIIKVRDAFVQNLWCRNNPDEPLYNVWSHPAVLQNRPHGHYLRPYCRTLRTGIHRSKYVYCEVVFKIASRRLNKATCRLLVFFLNVYMMDTMVVCVSNGVSEFSVLFLSYKRHQSHHSKGNGILY